MASPSLGKHEVGSLWFQFQKYKSRSMCVSGGHATANVTTYLIKGMHTLNTPGALMEQADGGNTVLVFFLSLVFTSKSTKSNNTPIHNASQPHFNLVWRAFILGFFIINTLHVDTILRSVVCFNKHLLLYITITSNHMKCRRLGQRTSLSMNLRDNIPSQWTYFSLNYKKSQPIRISNEKKYNTRVQEVQALQINRSF